MTPFHDDVTEPPEAEPPTLVEQALGLVELMSPSEYVEFVENLYGAGVPKKLSRQLAEAFEPAASAEIP